MVDGAQFFPQHCLYFFPLPQGQGSLRPTLGPTRTGFAFATASTASLTTSEAAPVCAPPVDPVDVAPAMPAVEPCCICLGKLRRKFSNASMLEALRKIL